MAFLGEGFATDTLPEGTGGDFQPLPAGWYTCSITGAELKETKAGTGQYIAVRYDITGPTNEGRVVFGNLNIKNPNPKAEEIGRQQLGDLMRAIGLSKVTDTDQLIGGNLGIKLAIRKSEEWGDSNDVKAYKSVSGSAAPSPSAKKSAPAEGASSATPPWAR